MEYQECYTYYKGLHKIHCDCMGKGKILKNSFGTIGALAFVFGIISIINPSILPSTEIDSLQGLLSGIGGMFISLLSLLTKNSEKQNLKERLQLEILLSKYDPERARTEEEVSLLNSECKKVINTIIV